MKIAANKVVSVMCVAGLGICASVAQAAPAAASSCTEQPKVASEMSEGVFHGIEDAMGLLSKQKYQEAIDKLSKMADSGSDYEKAVVNYNIGLAYASTNKHPEAVKAFAKALSMNALPQSQREQLQFNLGQLYIVVQQVDEGIKTLQNYISTACGTVPPEAHIFLANALTEKKRFAEALPQIQLAISKAKTPKEPWLQMQLAVAYELKDYKACAETLVQLITMVPAKPDYWKQLSSLFYEMKQDSQSVAVLALAERQGFIQKPSDFKNLYSVYMMLELPFKAGFLLQDAVDKGKVPADEKTLESISDAWINARESARAETTLKKLAAMSDRGEYYFKLGAMYGDDEKWKESREMLEKALNKGGLKRPGEAWMRLAVADYSMKEIPAAVDALQKAASFDETRKQASEWLRHLGGKAALAKS